MITQDKIIFTIHKIINKENIFQRENGSLKNTSPTLETDVQTYPNGKKDP